MSMHIYIPTDNALSKETNEFRTNRLGRFHKSSSAVQASNQTIGVHHIRAVGFDNFVSCDCLVT